MVLSSSEGLPGAFVISLDFELLWGIREGRAEDLPEVHRRVIGAREVVPRILDLFEEFDVAATWATVGFLFAASSDDVEAFAPIVRPSYRNAALSPYGDPVGSSEREDPLRLGRSLVRRIARTPRQEIATHTFSHYYCLEEGQARDTFRADLEAARAIAARDGIRLASIVFPRNQYNPTYDDILLENGIRAFRGNPPSRMWRFSTGQESRSAWRRGARLADAYAGRGKEGPTTWTSVPQPGGLSNVRASCMLRPYSPTLRHLEGLRLERIRRSLRFAGRTDRIFHLWWHPHNFGIHRDENLGFLRRVLQQFARCREEHGMRSLTMSEVDALVRERLAGLDQGPSVDASAVTRWVVAP